jgi:hypothetical protein
MAGIRLRGLVVIVLVAVIVVAFALVLNRFLFIERALVFLGLAHTRLGSKLVSRAETNAMPRIRIRLVDRTETPTTVPQATITNQIEAYSVPYAIYTTFLGNEPYNRCR